ncbi:MAG TPA: DUF1153 domain-containing protein [Allosphingosinicella sp.]|jgi:hypothetical protein
MNDVSNSRKAAPEGGDKAEKLPPPTTRWVARRKAQVVEAVRQGRLTLDEALARYRLTLEEFASWQQALRRHGLRGLQVAHIGDCRLADAVARARAQAPKRKPLKLVWSR